MPADHAKLALDALGLQEQEAPGRFYAAVRKATSHVRALAERHGGDVSFNFDSNGRSVWVMALFGKDAPPIAPLRRAQDRLRSFEREPNTIRSFETAR